MKRNTTLQKVQSDLVLGEIKKTRNMFGPVLEKWKTLTPSLALRQIAAVQNLLKKYGPEGRD